MIGKNVHWIGFVMAALALVSHSAYIQPWTYDDSFISFRYAENFAAGHGLVYNEGEIVEGYTTFLWVFLLGLGRMLGFDTVALAKGLALALSVATLLLLARLHRLVPSMSKGASATAAVLTGTCGIYTGWIMSGMEIALVSVWVVLAIVLQLRSREVAVRSREHWIAGLACALAVLSRPEFVLLFGVLFLERCARWFRSRDASVAPFAIAFFAVWAPYFLWRWGYYGWFFPNTFYAKVGDSTEQVRRGWKYVAEFSYPAMILLIPSLVGLLAREARSRITWIMAFVLIHTIYVVAVGGDHMPAYRFFSPIVGALAMTSAIAISCLPWVRVQVAIVLAGCAFQLLQSATHSSVHDGIVRDQTGDRGEEVGLWLRDYAPTDALLATNTAGSLPYYSRLRTIDMLGLADEHIAHREVETLGQGLAGHEKGDGEYVLSRKPDFIQFGMVRGKRIPFFRGGWEIYRSDEFKRWYALKVQPMPSGGYARFYERLGTPRTLEEAEIARKAEARRDEELRRERRARRKPGNS